MKKYSKQALRRKSVMETGNRIKNGTRPKSLMDRIKIKASGWGMLAVTCALLGMPVSSRGSLAAITQEPARGPGVSTPSRRMAVQVTNAGELIDNGKTFMLEFLLTNHGEDIKSYQIRDDISGSNQVAYDNQGNKCKVYAKVGGDYHYAPLPGQTPVKVKVFVTGFSSQAASFSRITVSGFCSYQTCDGAEGDYVFKNVMIPRQ
jgi:hypothetical protein